MKNYKNFSFFYQNMTSNIEDYEYAFEAKRALFPKKSSYKNMYDNINLTGLFQHSEQFNYSIYEIYSDSTSEKNFQHLAIYGEDFNTYWDLKGILSTDRYKIGNVIDSFVILHDDTFKNLKNTKSSALNIYRIKRLLWPDDKSIIAHKKIEYEICSQIIGRLGSEVFFKQQYNILGYKADIMFEIKHKSLIKSLSILFEVDEDGHKDRPSDYEEKRHKVCEYFSNRIVRISVPRNTPIDKIQPYVEKSVKKLKSAIDELVAQYVENECDSDYFISQLEQNNVEKKFINLFYHAGKYDDKYIYDHMTAGDELGYKEGADKKHKRLKGIIKNNLELGEDYILKEILLRDNIVPEQNKHKSSKCRDMKTSMYLMTRTGFFKLCMSANGVKARECRTMFAKVYELALKFATNMRIKMAKDGTSIYEKEKDVQDRIKEKIDKNSEAKLRIKIKELEEQLKRNEELKQQAESERDNKNTAYGDSQRKRRELVLQVEEKDKQITKLDKRKTKYMNNYKNSTLKLKELNEKVEKYEKKSVNNNSEQIKKRLQKYIDKSKKQEEIVKNLEDQIGQYKKKLEDKIRRNNCLIKLVNKLKKDIEKLKKQEESSDEESSS